MTAVPGVACLTVLQPGDAQRDVEGKDGGHVQKVERVAEEFQLRRAGEESQEVLQGEPEH